MNHTDVTPIDAEFLIDRGFLPWASNEKIFSRNYHRTGKTLNLFQKSKNEFMPVLFDITLTTTVKTRGDLARLLAVLGF